jgi:hypothetical protein
VSSLLLILRVSGGRFLVGGVFIFFIQLILKDKEKFVASFVIIFLEKKSAFGNSMVL